MKDINKTDLVQIEKAIIVKGNGFISFKERPNVFKFYSSYNFASRALVKLLRVLKLYCFVPMFYGSWKKYLRKREVIILFDAGVKDITETTRYIKHINPNIRIVFWYWNPVNGNEDAIHDDRIDQVWTYSRFDAKKFNLYYNPQFYDSSYVVQKTRINTDLLFLGKDKGRKEILKTLEKKAGEQGLKSNFVLVDDKNSEISYEDYLNLVADSRCIVDLVPSQSCGLTLRPLEALFFKKKLITNCRDIVNYSFYDKNNIFIIGVDNLSDLSTFINTPNRPIKKDVMDYYTFEKWLDRIVNNEGTRL